ncbi:MAG: DASS family sodium-coupled anion symporter [Candidatus Krumholzibacteriota bacterium]|nr:DASS family sodium-coupled anion symporter [Candidatus Krumholzibacteriota bacterium]
MSEYRYGIKNKIGLFTGPVLFLLVLILPRPEGLNPAAAKVAAVALLMAVWWISEAIPLAATALLPVVLFPALGVMNAADSTAPYANHLIFLFLGGFLIAVTMQKWNLHKRIAVRTIKLVGGGPQRLILGFMLASAFLSMWISNTATTMMMVPIGIAVIKQISGSMGGEGAADRGISPQHFRFGTALMLGVAYASSIGGVATIVGTPPNVVLAGFIESTYGQKVSFLSWMAIGVPLAAVMLVITWWYLTRIAFPWKVNSLPGGDAFLREQSARLGPITRPEKLTLAVFGLVALGWIIRGIFKFEAVSMISDSTIAILGAVLLFLIPVDFSRGQFLLDWKTAVRIPWSVIILFGGGLSLARGFKISGLDCWIGNRLTILEGTNYLVMISAVVFLTVFLTEITSNTATSAMLIPLMSGIALSMSIHPYGLIIAAGIASSYAFMLPVATPPNAIVFGSGQVSIPQMAKTGLVINLISWIVITLFIRLYLPLIWQIDLSTLPDWALHP